MTSGKGCSDPPVVGRRRLPIVLALDASALDPGGRPPPLSPSHGDDSTIERRPRYSLDLRGVAAGQPTRGGSPSEPPDADRRRRGHCGVGCHRRCRAGRPLDRVGLLERGTQGATSAEASAVSADGRVVAFTSASDLAGTPVGAVVQLYVRDRVAGSTVLASSSAAGAPAERGRQGRRRCGNVQFSISGNGRYVAFASAATNLTPADGDAGLDVFRKDLQTGAVALVSVNTRRPEGERRRRRGSRHLLRRSPGRLHHRHGDQPGRPETPTPGRRTSSCATCRRHDRPGRR